VNPSPAFWRGKRVLVTGHTGFKGAWLCAWLEHLGALAFGIALPPDTEPSLCALTHITQRVPTEFVDIREAAAVRAAMGRAAPDIVLHLAAQSLVRRSFREPVETFATNVMGTLHVLQAVRETASVRAVVVVTSDKCYASDGTARAHPEEDALGGADPYSASKACAEIATAAWRHSFLPANGPVALASARAGNVIGGGDWSDDRLIPDCVAALAAGRAIDIRNPAATRPWQHVLEPLAGYLILAERLHQDGAAFCRAWNFGPDARDAWPVSRIVEGVIAHWGGPGRWVASPAPAMPEAPHLAVDATLARERLGWVPRLPIGQALAWTADWYRRYHGGVPADGLVAADIARYEALQESSV
jgi:CDP-glucose 4,6-dehydratase